MLITPEELSKFSGNYPDDDSLQIKYIKSAEELIQSYVGYNPETKEDWKQTRIVSVFVYSVDGETFYKDAELTEPAQIPEGITPERTLYDNQYVYEATEEYIDIPSVFALVCMEIATLMQQEEGQNIGINSKSFANNGTRTFLNVVNYDKYLMRLARYKKGKIH